MPSEHVEQSGSDKRWCDLDESERSAWLARKARESMTWPVREIPITPDEQDPDV